VQRVDADVGRHRQAFALGPAQQLDPAALDRRHRCTRRRSRAPARAACAARPSRQPRTPDRPSRVATAPLAATHREPRILRPQPNGVAVGGAYCSARCSVRVLTIATSACEKPTQPASLSSAISVRARGQAARQRAERKQAAAAQPASAKLEHLDRPGSSSAGRCRQADQAGHATGRRRASSLSSMLHARAGSRSRAARSPVPVRRPGRWRRACVRREVAADVASATMRPPAMNRSPTGRVTAGSTRRPSLISNFMVPLALRAVRPRGASALGRPSGAHASFPAIIDITAMRTAMPNDTCGRITLCAPSATAESISTPRLIGPVHHDGVGWASASLSA